MLTVLYRITLAYFSSAWFLSVLFRGMYCRTHGIRNLFEKVVAPLIVTGEYGAEIRNSGRVFRTCQPNTRPLKWGFRGLIKVCTKVFSFHWTCIQSSTCPHHRFCSVFPVNKWKHFASLVVCACAWTLDLTSLVRFENDDVFAVCTA